MDNEPSAVIQLEGIERLYSQGEIICRADSNDPKKIEARTEEYRRRFANPFVAASRGFIDDVIQPATTRTRVARALAMLRDKKLANPAKKHANIPL